MKPIVGDVVLHVGIDSNGTNVHPAIVNRVWSQLPSGAWCCNLTVFPDCGTATARTSQYVYSNEQDAFAFRRGNNVSIPVGSEVSHAPDVAFQKS
jgi:hypothetical protein